MKRRLRKKLRIAEFAPIGDRAFELLSGFLALSKGQDFMRILEVEYRTLRAVVRDNHDDGYQGIGPLLDDTKSSP